LQALVSLVAVIALVTLSGFAVVLSDLALGNANAEADRDRQIQLDSATFLTGMLNQETGVRGYINTGDGQFLAPYNLGQGQVSQSEGRLGSEIGSEMRTLLSREETAAATWQSWAQSRVSAVSNTGVPAIDPTQSALGKQLFDTFRSASDAFGSQVASTLTAAQSQALSRSNSVLVASIASAVLIVALLVLFGVVAARSTLRPLGRLFETASLLAVGEPAEITDVGSDNEVGRLARALAAWKQTEVERLTLIKTATELNSLVDQREILDLAGRRLREVLDCPYVTISLADPRGLRIILSPGSEPTANQISVIESPSAHAFRSGQTVITDLRSSGWDASVARWRDKHAAGPTMAVPLVSTGHVLGVVTCVRTTDQAAFTPADRDRAELMAPSLASAIRVSLLFQNLHDTADQLELANRHKSVFLANMSHELRTPLNAILGFSELLIDEKPGQLDGKTRLRFLDQVHSSGQHLLSLINDILDLSKVEAGQMDLHLSRTSVQEAIKVVLTTIEPLAAKKKIRVVGGAESDIYVVADAGKLKQMLLNLVSNGIKFTPSGGRVTISALREESMVAISVTDTGIGIAEADLGSIFHEFKQLDSGPNRQQEGTGLGLALTKRFVELHGGNISTQSTSGVGSTFTLRLPLEKQGPHVESAQEQIAVPAPDISRPLILVVEDNPQAAELLGRHLAIGGFRMEVARTGAEALTKARELKPVAITLDILLPEMDGWEVLTKLKEEEAIRNIPVVVVSVVDNPELGRALGALDYFVKPVERAALLSRLGQYAFTTEAPENEVRVLVVDDEPANLQLLDAELKRAGFTVLQASGGKQGIEMARALQPHLVLLDLMMPGVSGFDVVEALRSDSSTSSIPIMVLTAKKLTDEDKRQLNGQVAAVFERNSLAGPELIGWLHKLVGDARVAGAVAALSR
jgi:signal transduction histidine kinase/CheY-like chemotaxis protein/CHASE3 domain sensor protein